MKRVSTAGQHRLKDSVYALEDPGVPGLYFRLGDPRVTLTPRPSATLAPATAQYRVALAARAIPLLSGQPHELVRLDA